MKMSKKISKKLIVSTLSTVMGVSLVGAISGTVAWYQYSTRSTVSFVGTSVASSKNLLISFNRDNNDAYANDLTRASSFLAPITSGAMLADDGLPEHFKAQPIYQHFDYSKWINAETGSYVQFDLFLKYNQINELGAEVPATEQKSVYLTDLLIRQHNADTHSDISDAVRVHVASENTNMLLSKKGETINVNGALDLNGDHVADKTQPIYSFYSQEEIDAIPTGTYGNGTQTAYKLDEVDPDIDSNGILSNGTVLGTLFSKAAHLSQGADLLRDIEICLGHQPYHLVSGVVDQGSKLCLGDRDSGKASVSVLEKLDHVLISDGRAA